MTASRLAFGVRPTLARSIRAHLGGLLADAFGPPEGGPRFADVLIRLEVAVVDAERRDRTVFEASLLTTMPTLRRFALSLTRDASAADDLVQASLLRAWRGRRGFALGTNLEAWTLTIMRNQFNSDHRKAREVQDEDDALAARLPTPPEQGGRLDLLDMRAALDRLAPAFREALVLVAIDEMSYEEAAAAMGCAIGTVKSRCWRAREQLARMLGYGGNEVCGSGVLLAAMDGRRPRNG